MPKRELPRLKKRTDKRTKDGRIIVENVNGSKSTERSITIQDERINQGKYTNIPTMFSGLLHDEAVARNIIAESKGIDPDTGKRLKGYDSLESAIKAAERRSIAVGRELDEIFKDDN